MPLVQIIRSGNATIGIWEMSETVDELIGLLDPESGDLCEMNQYAAGSRKREFLTVRTLLREMLGHYPSIRHDHRGKPQLLTSPRHLSISHSRKLTTVILADVPAGIDTEETTRRVADIAKRYLAEDELCWTSLASNPDLARLFCWCCKEAVYKMVGMDRIDFKKQISVSATEFHDTGVTGAVFISGNDTRTLKINYLFRNGDVIVWCTFD